MSSSTAPTAQQPRGECDGRGSMTTTTHVGEAVEGETGQFVAFIRKVSNVNAVGNKRLQGGSNADQVIGATRLGDGGKRWVLKHET